jgi:hypothetical protein
VSVPVVLTFVVFALCLVSNFLRNLSPGWRRQFNTCTPGFGQPDGNRLFGESGTMFPFAYVVKFFTHKFPGLGGRRFSFPRISLRPFDGHLIRHKKLFLSPSYISGG